MFFTATSFKIREISSNRTIQLVGFPQQFPITLQTKTGCSHSLPGQQVQNKKPQDLSNAGLFCQGKVTKQKSVYYRNISSKPKIIYKWFLCYMKK